ncbi:hypothetical protein ZIOFF_019877 [Zingiber officinale]|uniref:Auxin efflux carrier family protein n=1 Tax=Zingiber officinale TaxID=94328 RepID=A0A8J5HYG9_ZINOF|nr:hypothetical protein ZIOFF_019877 [Zingiber officinale]
MERSLLEIIINNQSGSGESIFASMKFAVLPIAKVFTMCFLGFLMASKYVNILSANGRKLLNGVACLFSAPTMLNILSTWTCNHLAKATGVVKLIDVPKNFYAITLSLTDALHELQIFVLCVDREKKLRIPSSYSNSVNNMSAHQDMDISVICRWFIPFNIILSTIFGSLVGFIVASVVRPPYPYFKFTIIHIGIGNIGNIPLVLIAALCRDKSNPFGDSVKCSQDGNAYISFGQWMLAPPPGQTFDGEEEEKLPTKLPLNNSETGKVPLLTSMEAESTSLESPKQQKVLDTENSIDRGTVGGKELPCLNFVQNDEKEEISDGELVEDAVHVILKDSAAKKSLEDEEESKHVVFQSMDEKNQQIDRLKFFLEHALAIIIGAIPFLKNFILTDDAPLFFFTDSCLILGEAMIPCILLALGGNLVDGPGPGSKRLGLRTTAAIIFGRLVLVPPTGLGIITIADKLGLFPRGDKMFKFVLLLQHTMPTSVLSGAVASLRGCGKEAASILFWVHIFAVFSMAGWIVLYLHMLF